jgi:CBS domain-containing protein
LADTIETLLAAAQHEFPVVDGFGKPVGLLVREDILSALKNHDRAASITTFMRSLETVRTATPLVAMLDRLHGLQDIAIAVTDSDGILVGLLTRQNLAEMMLIKTIQPNWRSHRIEMGSKKKIVSRTRTSERTAS